MLPGIQESYKYMCLGEKEVLYMYIHKKSGNMFIIDEVR